jgi:hypothetical protein
MFQLKGFQMKNNRLYREAADFFVIITMLVIVAIVATMVFAGVAHAATPPTVTKSVLSYGSNRYTVTVTDPATFEATPRSGDPSATGACTLNWVKLRRGHSIHGVTCTGPGTVTFTTPTIPQCDTPFQITADGVVFFTDLLSTPCPPPPPAAVVSSYVGGVVTFMNPATITQDAWYTVNFVSAAPVLTSTDPFTSTVQTNFAGTAPNRYVYYSVQIGVTLAAGQTITVGVA